MATFEEDQAKLRHLMDNCDNSNSDVADYLRSFLMETEYSDIFEEGSAFLENLINQEYEDEDSDMDSGIEDNSDSDSDDAAYDCECMGEVGVVCT